MLVELDLSFNFFESLPIDAFKSLKNLKFLNLGSNKIKVNLIICTANFFASRFIFLLNFRLSRRSIC